MKNNTKVIIALGVVLVLVLGIWFAVGRSPVEEPVAEEPVVEEEEEEEPVAEEPDDAIKPPVAGQPTTLPLVEPGTVRIRIATNDNHYAPASYEAGLPVWNELERLTGVIVEWELIPAAELPTVMGTRLAAGVDLPDFFWVPGGNPLPFVADGVIKDITDLIRDHGPYTTAFLKDQPDVRKELTAPDGRIYHFASVVSGTDTGDPSGWLIRQDWLDYLGLEMPTSIDEWVEVWRAFKLRDPNQNDLADEIPLTVRGIHEVGRFGDAWGLQLYWFRHGWRVENERVVYDWIDPRTQSFLRFAHKIYEEGLLDPDFLTQTAGDRLGKIARNLVGSVDRWILHTTGFTDAARDGGDPNADYAVAPPPSGPYGYRGHQSRYGVTEGMFSFSTTMEHPEIFMRWVDFMYASPVGNMLATFGIEGQSYNIVNGEPVFSDWVFNHPEGLGLGDALRSLGAKPTIPWIRAATGPFSKQPRALIANNPELLAAVEQVEPFLIHPMPRVLPTHEESEEMTRLLADIDTFRLETIAQFIVGDRDLEEEWDDYVAQMKALGIERVIEIRQQMYDRWLALE